MRDWLGFELGLGLGLGLGFGFRLERVECLVARRQVRHSGGRVRQIAAAAAAAAAAAGRVSAARRRA